MLYIEDIAEPSNPQAHVSQLLLLKVIHEFSECRKLSLQFHKLLLYMRNNIHYNETMFF